MTSLVAQVAPVAVCVDVASNVGSGTNDILLDLLCHELPPEEADDSHEAGLIGSVSGKMRQIWRWMPCYVLPPGCWRREDEQELVGSPGCRPRVLGRPWQHPS
jgi:hypothetical protein